MTLWIAFSSLYLRCYSQSLIKNNAGFPRCELLSVLYICGVIHSETIGHMDAFIVVNCFQFFIFAVLFTVFFCGFCVVNWLWIAFSSLYLRCYSQCSCRNYAWRDSCELLSVLYICGVIHSRTNYRTNGATVVNCFQFFIFAVLFTVQPWEK